MPVSATISTDAQKVMRRLQRINKRGVGFAWDRAVTAEVKRIRLEIHRQYGRYVKVKRKATFPKNILKAYREGSSRGGRLVRGKVRSFAADDILKRMFDGGVKKPKKSTKLFVPIRKGGKPVPRPRDKSLEYVDARGVVYRKTPGGKISKLPIGIMKYTTRDKGPAKFQLRKAAKLMAERFRRELHKEYLRALRHRARRSL